MKRFFDEEKKRLLVNLLRLGISRRVAAASLGCHVMTIYNEAARDSKLAHELRDAEASFVVRHTARIEKASLETKYWRASAWSLERRHPELYSLRKPNSVTPDQAERIFSQFALILTRYIPDVRLRESLEAELWRVIDLAVAVEQKLRHGEAELAAPMGEEKVLDVQCVPTEENDAEPKQAD